MPTSTDALLEEIADLERQRARLEARIEAKALRYADEVRREIEREAPESVNLATAAASTALSEVLLQPTRAVTIRLARARLVRSQLPATWLAHRAGDLDAARVRVIAETAYGLVTDDARLQLDNQAAAALGPRTLALGKAWLRRFVARTEPEHAGRRERQEAQERRVYVDHGENGWSWLNALIPTPDAIRIDRALTTAAEKRADGTPTTLEQARSDVLADTLLGRNTADNGVTGGRRGGLGRVDIAITVPVTTLSGHDDAPGQTLDGSVALPAHIVRELVDETNVFFHRLLTDPAGRVLDVTHLTYRPPPGLRFAVAARDGTCLVTTCDRPALDGDIDHDEPWPHGPTTGANLGPRCRTHHRLKTAGLLPTPRRPSRLQHDIDRALACPDLTFRRIPIEWVA